MSHTLSDILIKPNSLEEEDYCKKYNLEILQLKNGIRIVGIQCKKDASFYSNINFIFSEGAYGNKAGGVHFLEHFINKKLRMPAERNGLQVGAWTSPIEVGEKISGVANPNATNYGVWSTLPKVRASLESPTSTVSSLSNTITTEKNVIKSEFKMRKANHDIRVGDHRRKVVFASENPLSDFPPVIGQETDIDGMTINDLKKIERKVLVPKNLLISYYYEGGLSGAQKLSSKLTTLFDDFPRENKKKNEIDQKLLGRTHPNFRPGAIYRNNTELKNSLITTEYVWVLNNKMPEIPYLALRTLRPFIASELFNYSRKKGWGYNTSVQVLRPNDEVGIVVIRIDSRKDHIQDYAPGIKQVLSEITKSSSAFCKLEKKRQVATPLAVVDRLDWATDGLKDYNAIIDADKIREFTLEITGSDMNAIIEKLLSTEPATIITGDLDA